MIRKHQYIEKLQKDDNYLYFVAAQTSGNVSNIEKCINTQDSAMGNYWFRPSTHPVGAWRPGWVLSNFLTFPTSMRALPSSELVTFLTPIN